MEIIDTLRQRVSAFDATLADLVSSDPEKRENAVLDAAALLTAAKVVVLDG